MRRTNFTTKLISVILCVFLLTYFGIYLVQSMQNSIRTAPAVTLQAEEFFFAPGIIIREETVITVDHPVVASLVREGERVSVGMVYMVAYASEADRERDIRRGQLEREIAHLEVQLATVDGGLGQTAAAEAEIRRQIRELNYGTRQGNLEGLEDQTIALRALALAGNREGLSSRLADLRSELGLLSGGAVVGNVTPIFANQSGIFSSRVDGYESLSPEDLHRLDLEIVRELLERRRSGGQRVGDGKIVSGSTWYYVALVPESEAERLVARLSGEVPNRVTVSFSALTGTDIPMWVHSLGAPEEGYRVAVFAATTALAETLSLRQVEARIVYNSFSGIRVPREALHWGETDEATGVTPAYVFTLTVSVAERKFVVVLYEGPYYFLVRPDLTRTSAAAAFREGNTIIVAARELYDGRVLRR